MFTELAGKGSMSLSSSGKLVEHSRAFNQSEFFMGQSQFSWYKKPRENNAVTITTQENQSTLSLQIMLLTTGDQLAEVRAKNFQIIRCGKT